MIMKNEDGTYFGDYVFRGGPCMSRTDLEKALTRVRTLLSIDICNGEILYHHQLNLLYKENIVRFFDIMSAARQAHIKILSVEIIEEGGDLGLRIVFKLVLIGYKREITETFAKWLETDQMSLVPRMIGSKHNGVIDHFDIITFDLVPKENASTETEVDLKILNLK